MFIIYIDRYYSYKDIYGYIYMVQIDQIKRIIRIYDVRFHKDDPNIGDFLKNKIYKITFNEIDEKKEDNI